MPEDNIERQLFLKQLQINRLLDITQAINNNAKQEDLFTMYKSFLNWEMGVREFALFLPDKNDGWQCVVMDGVKNQFIDDELVKMLSNFGNIMKKVRGSSHLFAQQFEMLIPVFHKERPLGYAFIGGYEGTDFSKIQLITTITNIVAVAIDNKNLFKRQIEQERFNHEMALAGEMQRALVPDKLPECDIFQLSAIYKPHFGVGGDYFDCFELRNNRYMFVVADIAGKGLSAALLMANFQANLHAIVRRAKTPDEFIRQLNKAVWRVTHGERYITLFVADINTETREMRYINAGHIPPVVVQRGQIELLKKGCMILGYEASLPHLEIGKLTLEEDAMMVIYTDGITDIRNPLGEDFNEDILANFICENANISAHAFNEKLMKQVEEFSAGEGYPDDITVLTCRFFEHALVEKV